MRNTLVGAILAIVLLAGLFLAADNFSRPGEKPAPALTPREIADQTRPDFIGERKIGEWRLICIAAKELPRPPSSGGHSGNSAGAAPKEVQPPPGWKIPRCRAMMGLRSTLNPAEQVRLTFRQVGFKRVLALFLRFPPQELENGDVVTLHLDQADWQIPIRSCAAAFCLAIQSIKFADVPLLENAKRLVLSFKPASSQKDISITVPLTGLAESLRAIRRIDQ